jgi:hypothetical protein
MRPAFAGAKIDHAVRRGERPLVGVPLIRQCRVAAVSLCQPLDRSDSLGARDHTCELGFVAFVRGLSACLARQIESLQRFVKLPALSVPDQPPAPWRHVAQARGMSFTKAKREGFITECRRSIVFLDCEAIQLFI